MRGQLHASAVTSGNHWIRSWLGARAGLNAVAKRRNPYRELNPFRPTRNLVLILTELPLLIFIHCIRKLCSFIIHIHIRGCNQKFPDWVETTRSTRWEVTQRVMAAKLIRLAHKTAIQVHLLTAVPFAVLAPGGHSGNFWIHIRMYCVQGLVMLKL
jgi:hypothetical protein